MIFVKIFYLISVAESWVGELVTIISTQQVIVPEQKLRALLS